MNSSDPAALKLEVLLSHLDRSERAIRAYDDLIFRIKAFAVTAVSAATLIAVQQHIDLLYLVGILAAVGFLLMDAQAKSVQRLFILRSEVLEAFFRDLPPSKPDGDDALLLDERAQRALSRLPTLSESFGAQSSLGRVGRELGHRSTYFLYLSIAVLVLAVFLLRP